MITAFDIGGSKILTGQFGIDDQKQSLSRSATPTDNYDALLQCLVDGVTDHTGAVGVSIAGVVDTGADTVAAANIPCLQDRLLANDLSRIVGKPVYLINDANAFAMAEACLGAGRDYESVFALILGTGLGGAVIFNGKVHAGRNGTAGEWGHAKALLPDHFPECPDIACGCGEINCLDVFGGARGMERLYTLISNNEKSAMEILTLWKQGDEAARTSIGHYLEIVSAGLAPVLNVLDPHIVVVGGGLSNDVELMQAIRKTVQSRALARSRIPEFRIAEYGPDAGLAGAMLHAKSMLSQGG